MTFQQQVALAKEKENSLRELVEVIESRVSGNHSGRLPLLRLRARLALNQAVLDTRQREITLRAAQQNLAVILGRPQEASFRLTTPLRDFKVTDVPSLSSLTSAALDNRPDLLALRLSLEKTKLDRDLVVAQRWDNFVISAGLSTQAGRRESQ